MQNQQQSPRRQRNRISFSCTNCRHGKYRCDRRMPCTTCVRRGKQGTCQYEEAAVELAHQRSVSSEAPASSSRKGSPTTKLEQLPTHPAKIVDLERFGYSKMGSYNTLGIFREISRIDPDTASSKEVSTDTMPGTPLQTEKYLRLLRELPPRLYVNILVDLFFTQVNWQYGFIDRSFFTSQLADFYKSSRSILVQDQGCLSSDVLLFPALLFQVVASALQFVPSEYDPALDDLCMGRSFIDLAKSYSDSGVEILSLFEKESLNLISIQAGFLRVALLKGFGYVVESWHTLGQVVMDAREIGLNRDDDVVLETLSVKEMCSRLWVIEMRRRVVVNLMLWDSQMGVVLGKPSNIDPHDWSTILPLDTEIPMDRTLTVPQARQPHEKPNQFTQRLVEIRLHSKLPDIRAHHAEGRQYPKEYIESFRQEFYNNLEVVSPQFRFDNADTTWDEECPWLRPQREYVQSTTWLLLLIAHRPYIFNVPECRSEVLKAGIKVLRAQERNYRSLGAEFGKLFTLAFITLEAATAIMAVLIASPTENGQSVNGAIFQVKESIARLKAIGGMNHFALPAADVLQSLMNRAENMSALTDRSLGSTGSPQENTIQNPVESQLQPGAFDFNNYSEMQTVGFPRSDASITSSKFDFNFGGIMDTFAPTSNLVDGDLSTSIDAWDPMILMGWSDMIMGDDCGVGSYFGQNVQGVVT